MAKLTVSAPKPAVVVDETKLLDWCHREHPTEVFTETRQYLTPAFRQVLLSRLEVGDDGCVCDTTTGQVVDWARPVPAGPPRTVMTFTTDGRTQIADAYTHGRLTITELLAVEPAQPTDPD